MDTLDALLGAAMGLPVGLFVFRLRRSRRDTEHHRRVTPILRPSLGSSDTRAFAIAGPCPSCGSSGDINHHLLGETASRERYWPPFELAEKERPVRQLVRTIGRECVGCGHRWREDLSAEPPETTDLVLTGGACLFKGVTVSQTSPPSCAVLINGRDFPMPLAGGPLPRIDLITLLDGTPFAFQGIPAVGPRPPAVVSYHGPLCQVWRPVGSFEVYDRDILPVT